MLTRMYASLCFYSDQFDPEALADTIGLSTYDYSRKGERRALGVVPHSVLTVTSRDEIEGCSADVHIMSLIEKISPMYQHIRAALGSDGYILCFLFCEGNIENVGVHVSPQTLRQLVAIDAGLSIDTWAPAATPGPEDGDEDGDEDAPHHLRH
ncbi:DUF4279 domain-containing protein [Cupriavidus basilensis]|uniref:DUF4279 domain-containing protein n=1 Tax=Cupriavidus basilensis TaxID=68895 RepID=A0A643FVM9_9BURK|nr:DUF4279 domain-containing protein [Cupriavidus basilensis]QOT79264.1 DUF4279 domain-containing protein [Cupriavidus basilensis]